jgi:hypothetical protein
VANADDEELDLRVRIGLLGTDGEREQAVALLVSRFQKPVMKFLADRFADLSSDDRASAVDDAFLTVHRMAINRTLDVDSPLHPCCSLSQSVGQLTSDGRHPPGFVQMLN